MAEVLGADTLRYLPIESVARSIDRPEADLCEACISGRYPTPAGERLYEIALDNARADLPGSEVGRRVAEGRTYEPAPSQRGEVLRAGR